MNVKVLALDYGTKRIGIASGDRGMGIAFPRDIVDNNPAVFDKIEKLCVDLDVKIVIIGLPLSAKEEYAENKVMKSLRVFVDMLKKRLDLLNVEIEYVDERFSSFEASAVTGKSGLSKKDKLDAHAAQVILQRYFDKFKA